MSKTNHNTLLWSLFGLGAVVAARTVLSRRRTMLFRDKTVLITGGSRGLGLVMARAFAGEGARVAICARDADELRRAEADLRQYTPTVLALPCDLTNPTAIDGFVREVEAVFGPVDVLVNNASIIMVSPYENTTEADFREVMETNFWAAYHMTNAVLPAMRKTSASGQKRIVNIASVGGKLSLPHMAPYSASKFALVGYSEGLRSELMKDGICVTTVCPGLIRTGSPRHAIIKGQHNKEYAWFKIADSLPLLTVSAETCARQVLEACRVGRAELIVSLPAQLITKVHGLLPGFTADVLSFINRLLPDASPAGEARLMGYESETTTSRSIAARLTDEAVLANNE